MPYSFTFLADYMSARGYTLEMLSDGRYRLGNPLYHNQEPWIYFNTFKALEKHICTFF